jgi:hypothetical protein
VGSRVDRDDVGLRGKNRLAELAQTAIAPGEDRDDPALGQRRRAGAAPVRRRGHPATRPPLVPPAAPPAANPQFDLNTAALGTVMGATGKIVGGFTSTRSRPRTRSRAWA